MSSNLRGLGSLQQALGRSFPVPKRKRDDEEDWSNGAGGSTAARVVKPPAHTPAKAASQGKGKGPRGNTVSTQPVWDWVANKPIPPPKSVKSSTTSPVNASSGPRASPNKAQPNPGSPNTAVAITCSLAGTRHRSAQVKDFLQRAGPSEVPVILVREPDNPVDRNAIQVTHPAPAGCSSAQTQHLVLGHVPAKLAALLAPLLDTDQARITAYLKPAAAAPHEDPAAAAPSPPAAQNNTPRAAQQPHGETRVAQGKLGSTSGDAKGSVPVQRALPPAMTLHLSCQPRAGMTAEDQHIAATQLTAARDTAQELVQAQEAGHVLRSKFSHMLNELMRLDKHLFSVAELQCMQAYQELQPAQQALLLRLFLRQGPWFALRGIEYREVGSTEAAAAALIVNSLLAAPGRGDCPALVDMLSAAKALQLAQLLGITCVNSSSRRADLSKALLESCTCTRTRQQEVLHRSLSAGIRPTGGAAAVAHQGAGGQCGNVGLVSGHLRTSRPRSSGSRLCLATRASAPGALEAALCEVLGATRAAAGAHQGVVGRQVASTAQGAALPASEDANLQGVVTGDGTPPSTPPRAKSSHLSKSLFSMGGSVADPILIDSPFKLASLQAVPDTDDDDDDEEEEEEEEQEEEQQQGDGENVGKGREMVDEQQHSELRATVSGRSVKHEPMHVVQAGLGLHQAGAQQQNPVQEMQAGQQDQQDCQQQELIDQQQGIEQQGAEHQDSKLKQQQDELSPPSGSVQEVKQDKAQQAWLIDLTMGDDPVPVLITPTSHTTPKQQQQQQQQAGTRVLPPTTRPTTRLTTTSAAPALKAEPGDSGLRPGGLKRTVSDGVVAGPGCVLQHRVLDVLGPCARLPPLVSTTLQHMQRVYFLNEAHDMSRWVATERGAMSFPPYTVWRTRSAFPSRQALLAYESALVQAGHLDDCLTQNDLEGARQALAPAWVALEAGDLARVRWTASVQQEEQQQEGQQQEEQQQEEQGLATQQPASLTAADSSHHSSGAQQPGIMAAATQSPPQPVNPAPAQVQVEGQQGAASEQAAGCTVVPLYLARFCSAWVYAGMCTVGVSLYEKSREYPSAVKALRALLAGNCCPGRRGEWWLRLSIDLEHLGEEEEALCVAEQALKDPWVRHGDLLALKRRVLRLGKPPRRWKKPGWAAAVSAEPPEVVIQATPLAGATGMKSKFYSSAEEGRQISVETLALEHYASGAGGGWCGLHCEGGVWSCMMGLLMWDCLFSNVPDVFRTPFQTAPLDLGTDAFYPARKQQIDKRLQEIADGAAHTLLAKCWAAHKGQWCRGVNWERYSLEILQEIARCVGGLGLSVVCRMLAEDHSGWSGGMPDLLLWRPQQGDAKLVEVKGPRDRLSDAQRAWIAALDAVGVRCEVLRVQERVPRKGK